MSAVVTFLSGRLGRPIEDRTGLTGRFSWELKWAPDENEFRPAGVPAPEAHPTLDRHSSQPSASSWDCGSNRPRSVSRPFYKTTLKNLNRINLLKAAAENRSTTCGRSGLHAADRIPSEH